MNKKLQMACVWCGPLFVVMLFGGIILAGMMPPPSPHDGPQQVADFWRNHTDQTRIGLLLLLIGGGVSGPYSAMLCVMLRRMEGGRDSPMTFVQLIGGATGMIAVCFPAMIFMVAAFRPDRSPELTVILNDFAWIPFIVNFPPALLQCLAISGAVLTDKSETPVFPRWVGYYNLWTATGFIPAGLLIFFKHGPFAWNGVFPFWLAATLFGTWFLVMSFMMGKAVNRHAAAELQPA